MLDFTSSCNLRGPRNATSQEGIGNIQLSYLDSPLRRRGCTITALDPPTVKHIEKQDKDIGPRTILSRQALLQILFAPPFVQDARAHARHRDDTLRTYSCHPASHPRLAAPRSPQQAPTTEQAARQPGEDLIVHVVVSFQDKITTPVASELA
jgi:hypothetical protein